MRQVPVKRKDIKRLGDRLSTLASLSDADATLLRAVFAVAADVLSPENEVGYTTLVQADGKDRLTITVPDDDWTPATEDGPDRVAAAHTPGRLPAVDEDMARKITGRATDKITGELTQNKIKITGGHTKKITGAVSLQFELESHHDKPGDDHGAAPSDQEPE
jgi:hypothetical protein